MAALYEAIKDRNWQDCENCLQGEIDVNNGDNCCLKKFKKTALELVVEASLGENDGDREVSNRVAHLLIREGINVARSLVNARNAKNWSVLQSILDLILSLNLTENVNESLQDNYLGNSVQEMSSAAKLGAKMEQFKESMTRAIDNKSEGDIESLLRDFLALSVKIHRNRSDVMHKYPESNEDISTEELAVGMSLDDEFMGILKQFVNQEDKEPSGEAGDGREKLKVQPMDKNKGLSEGGDLQVQLESLADDKRRAHPYYMSLEWFSRLHSDPQEQSDNEKEKETAKPGTSNVGYGTEVHEMEGKLVNIELPLQTVDDNDVIKIALDRSEELKSKALKW